MDGPTPLGGDDQIRFGTALLLPVDRERADGKPIRGPCRSDRGQDQQRQIPGQKGPGAPQREIGEPSHGRAPYFAATTTRHGPCTGPNANPVGFPTCLSADQQAMLQLLLERGQRYADLASVLGVDEAEVRSRARQALTELAGADPDRNVGLTDYLLGQADPIGRADAVRHLKDDPEDLSLATELSQKLLLLAPEADLPRPPGEERRPRAGRRSGPSTGRESILGRFGAGESRRRRTRQAARRSLVARHSCPSCSDAAPCSSSSRSSQ